MAPSEKTDPQINAVVVATPTRTHFAIAADALKAGKHVLVEKPMCAIVAEAEKLAELALLLSSDSPRQKQRLATLLSQLAYHAEESLSAERTSAPKNSELPVGLFRAYGRAKKLAETLVDDDPEGMK